MTSIKLAGPTPSLADRTQELKQSLARLRSQYHQANAKIELGPPGDPMVVRQRTVAHRQLAILVPMHRALSAMAQQGRVPNHKARTLYLEQFSRAIALVGHMVPWADGSEEEYAELLALRVPVDVKKLFTPGTPVAPLRNRLDEQRFKLEDAQRAVQSLVSDLVKSFTPEQRAMMQKYHQLTRGSALRLLPSMWMEAANG